MTTPALTNRINHQLRMAMLSNAEATIYSGYCWTKETWIEA